MHVLEPFRVAIAILVSLFLFLGGWWVNGNRWESKYHELQKAHAVALAKAVEEARQKELTLQATYNQTQEQKDAEIRNITGRLDDALERLRLRETRASPKPVPVPSPACPQGTPKGATGAELFREDAEFLAREAARADTLAVELNACYAAYRAAKKAYE